MTIMHNGTHTDRAVLKDECWLRFRFCAFVVFRVMRSQGKMYIRHGRLYVCLSDPRHIPTLLHGPGCKCGNGRECPVVVLCLV